MTNNTKMKQMQINLWDSMYRKYVSYSDKNEKN